MLLFVGSFIVVATVGSFVGDVRNAARQASGPLSNVNRNFAGVANSLIRSDQSLDKEFSYLLSQGGTMSRVSVASRLNVMNAEAKSLAAASQNLAHPAIADNLNIQLDSIITERTQAWLSLIQNIEARLQLPLTTDATVTNPEVVLRNTHRAWGLLRYKLQNKPGRVLLLGTTSSTTNYLQGVGLSNLTSSATLHLSRSVSISAVQINPLPLPRDGNVLVVPATGRIHLGVVVTNWAYCDQPVSIRIMLTDSSGRRATQTVNLHFTLGPSASHAFVPADFRVSTSEHATLTISLLNAPHRPGVPTGRTYQVLTIPAG
jgi:hypothetical protein